MKEKRVFDKDGYDQNGYDKFGYNRNFEIDESSPLSIRDINTLKALGYENNGLDFRGFRFDEIHHITRTKYDEQGYDINGWNQEGIHMETQSEYNPKGFNIKGIHENGTPYDDDGYDMDGFNAQGINKRHFRRDGTNTYTNKKYDLKGYDINGYDYKGYDINGIDQLGYNKDGVDKNGYDIFGNNKQYPYSYELRDRYNYDEWRELYNREQYVKNHSRHDWFSVGLAILNFGTRTLWGKDGYTFGDYTYDELVSSWAKEFYDVGVDRDGYDRKGYNFDGINRDGYDIDGYNADGININGLTREEQADKDAKEQETKKNQQRKNYLELKYKAKKLGKGEMTLEYYIKCSKTSIDDLIDFAKKQHMDADVIRGLYKYKKPYTLYKKPFSKKQYLESTILLIDGQEVKPTEEDVDKCVGYLTAIGSLVCDKTVRDTVRKYLKGEIDITLKTEELQEQIEENKSTIAENEEEIKDTLTEVIISQQNRIKAQENEIVDLKSQRRDIDG